MEESYLVALLVTDIVVALLVLGCRNNKWVAL